MSDEAIAVSIDGGLFVPEEYSQEILKAIQDDPQIIDNEIIVNYTTLATALKSLDFWVTKHPGQGTQITGYGRKWEEHHNEYPTMSISWKTYNPHKLIQHLASRAVSGASMLRWTHRGTTPCSLENKNLFGIEIGTTTSFSTLACMMIISIW